MRGARKITRRLGGIGVIAIDHDVVVRVDIAKHLAHHVSFALAGFMAHDSAPRSTGDTGRAV